MIMSVMGTLESVLNFLVRNRGGTVVWMAFQRRWLKVSVGVTEGEREECISQRHDQYVIARVPSVSHVGKSTGMVKPGRTLEAKCSER